MGNLRVIEISRTVTSGVVKFFFSMNNIDIIKASHIFVTGFRQYLAGKRGKKFLSKGKMDGVEQVGDSQTEGIIDDCLTPVTAVPP